MPVIVRVEDNMGMGCYVSHMPLGFIDEHTKYNGHPRPEHDKGIERYMENGVEICGFIDEEQAHNWFTEEELSAMEEYGFYLKEVLVNMISAIGEKQVLAIL